MKGNIEERAQALAMYMIEHKATVRSAAKAFGVSKSTVHMDVTIENGLSGSLGKWMEIVIRRNLFRQI